MSLLASEARELFPGVFQWGYFSPEHKVELTSHAVLADGHLFVFDPIGLAEGPLQQLIASGKVAAIVLTNENHERAAGTWREITQAPVWAGHDVFIGLAGVNRWPDSVTRMPPWEISSLDGGAGGEITARWRERSLVVFGDGIFNLPTYGFGLLPAKYCRNQAVLKQSLLRLTEEPFETALFAHGAPIRHGASAKIRELARQ
jgi:hypothetical protein